MPKPRRRRRFFALEGRFEVDTSGELHGIADPAQGDPSETFVPNEEAGTASGTMDPGLAGGPDAPTSPEEDMLPPAFRLNRSPHSRPVQRPFSRWSVLLSPVCLMVGALAGFLWTRAAQKPVIVYPSSIAQKGVTPLARADQDDLDAAYEARHAHRFDEATQLFTALGHRHPDWGAVEVERGRTLFYENKPYDASAALTAAIEKGWKPAEAYFLLGVLGKAQKSYVDAESNFARAVAVDPTQPDYYFFWGECLRDEGKLLDATAKFRSALLRNQYETATGLYRAKLWLCAIEAETQASDGVSAQVDAALAEPHPPMEAFIAASARDYKAGDFHAAAAHLSAASQRGDPIVFRYILSDQFFASARTKPEFAGFFPSAPPTASPAAEGATGSPTPSATP